VRSLPRLLVGVLHNLDDDGLLVHTAEALKQVLKLRDPFTSLNLDDRILSISIASLLLGIQVVGSLSVGVRYLVLHLQHLRHRHNILTH
jgi:hypothetical protein